MGKLADFTAEKMKNGKTLVGQYMGAHLIKGFWNMGIDTYKDAAQRVHNVKNGTQDISNDFSVDNSVNSDDIEKWLDKKAKIKKNVVNLGEGERYLRARESMGLNLQEIDKYYQNLSWLCLFFVCLVVYCFGSAFYYLSIGKVHIWLLSYFLTGFLFVIFYLYFALDAASILNRKHIEGKLFLQNPSLWIPRFKLPYDWRIKD